MQLKQETKNILHMLLGVVVGLLLGIYVGWKYTGKAMMETINELGVGEAKLTILTLESIRNGNDNQAITILENRLDGEISRYLHSKPEREPSKKLMEKDIELARSYRTKYPYKSGFYSQDRDVEFVLKLKEK